MTLLITGSRNLGGDDMATLNNYLDGYHASTPITRLLSGGAGGTDLTAEAWAKARNIEVVTIRPSYLGGNGKYAPLLRNSALVAAAKEVGATVVGYQPQGATNGTQDTLRKARKVGLRVLVLTGRGVEVQEGMQLALL